jgi:valyl-tRNA synthetase
MSKSLGNSPEPLNLIRDFGADGVRMGMMLAAPAGNDILFDESLCEQGRNFNNKIWNAYRLVKGWQVDETLPQPKSSRIAVEWFGQQLQSAVNEMDDLFGKFRLSEALMTVYKLFWDEFSSWYLETIKPAYQHAIDAKTLQQTLGYFESLLELLHPFMPFITEELWQNTQERGTGESIMLKRQPNVGSFDGSILNTFETTKAIVSAIRTIRLEKNIPNKELLELQALGTHEGCNDAVLIKMANLSAVRTVDEKPAGAVSFMVGTTEYAIPMGSLIKIEEEIAKMKAEIAYLQGFLKSVLGKLGNERFVANAKPEVVEAERKKQADAESKIRSLEESMASLQK